MYKSCFLMLKRDVVQHDDAKHLLLQNTIPRPWAFCRGKVFPTSILELIRSAGKQRELLPFGMNIPLAFKGFHNTRSPNATGLICIRDVEQPFNMTR